MEQPTEDELRIALEISILLGKKADLRRLMMRKTTWLGDSENALRIEIDQYLISNREEFQSFFGD